jgi:hypothetical protein
MATLSGSGLPLELRLTDDANSTSAVTLRLSCSPVPKDFVDGDVWEIRAETPGKPPRVLVHDIATYADTASNLGPGPECVQHARSFVDKGTP